MYGDFFSEFDLWRNYCIKNVVLLSSFAWAFAHAMQRRGVRRSTCHVVPFRGHDLYQQRSDPPCAKRILSVVPVVPVALVVLVVLAVLRIVLVVLVVQVVPAMFCTSGTGTSGGSSTSSDHLGTFSSRLSAAAMSKDLTRPLLGRCLQMFTELFQTFSGFLTTS